MRNSRQQRAHDAAIHNEKYDAEKKRLSAMTPDQRSREIIERVVARELPKIKAALGI